MPEQDEDEMKSLAGITPIEAQEKSENWREQADVHDTSSDECILGNMKVPPPTFCSTLHPSALTSPHHQNCPQCRHTIDLPSDVLDSFYEDMSTVGRLRSGFRPSCLFIWPN